MPIGRPIRQGRSLDASGRRDKLVDVQLLSSETSGGFPVPTWTTSPVKWWLHKRELRADERFASNQESAFAETEWHGDYRADMDPDLIDVPAKRRLVYNGRTYDIVAAALIEKRGIEVLTLVSSQV